MTGTCESDVLQRSVAHSPFPKQKLGPELSVERDAVFSLLKQLAVDNEAHFQQCHPTMYAKRIVECCHEISISTDIIKNLVKELQNASRKYDYDEHTPGNGFRSLVCVCDIVLLRLISMLRACSENRTAIMFRVAHHCKEIESFGAILRFLTLAFHQVISMIGMLDESSLFPPLDGDYDQFNGIMKGIESLDASCFYGRLLGYQFTPSVTKIFRVIGIVLATYSLSWESRSTAFGSLINSGKMLLNPEQRAVRIIKVTREADIEFCRGFWNLSELPMPKLFCPAMAICENREIEPSGLMPMGCLDGKQVLIPEPSAHTGIRPVLMKVISASHRIGLSPANVANRLPLSNRLVIHCHGGGYVATSSKSHESYLRYWAKSLDCPFVSIDYSLAPENPFPRATEEVIYAYAWILNNPEKLGWTGGKVCMVGDSAGGNLIMSVNLRLIELNVKRLPDGLVPIYTPFLFQYLPSPSRVLSFMDPLLHMGVVIRCAAAYTGSYSDEELDKTCSFRNKPTSPVKHKSLVQYVDQVQKAQRDNFLDFSHGSQSIVSLINLTQSKAPSSMYSSDISKSEMNKNCADTEINKNVADAALKPTIMEPNLETDGTETDEIEEEDDGDITQIVHVDGDPFHICLSSTNFDQHLIDYLQMHPITKRSVHRSTAEDFVSDEEEDVNQIEMNENVLDTNVTPERSQFPKSLTADGMSSIMLSSPASAMSLNECRQSSSFLKNGNRLTASAGRAPPKKKLTRHKGRSLSQSLVDTASLAAGHAYDNLSDWFDAPKTPVGHVDKQKLTRAVTMSAQRTAEIQLEEAEKHESHFTELLKLKLPRDYLMSPLYAPSELLKKLPPVRFVACHLDPLLDDTIMFAKRMRDSGGPVKSIDLLDSLPHGFLNFAPMSVDCREGANLCLQRIKETLNDMN